MYVHPPASTMSRVKLELDNHKVGLFDGVHQKPEHTRLTITSWPLPNVSQEGRGEFRAPRRERKRDGVDVGEETMKGDGMKRTGNYKETEEVGRRGARENSEGSLAAGWGEKKREKKSEVDAAPQWDPKQASPDRRGEEETRRRRGGDEEEAVFSLNGSTQKQNRAHRTAPHFVCRGPSVSRNESTELTDGGAAGAEASGFSGMKPFLNCRCDAKLQEDSCVGSSLLLEKPSLALTDGGEEEEEERSAEGTTEKRGEEETTCGRTRERRLPFQPGHALQMRKKLYADRKHVINEATFMSEHLLLSIQYQRGRGGGGGTMDGWIERQEMKKRGRK
ncbi:hypothetical protein EYF80_015044 [Liparis tanakae]|uniref:Uncharacterized protein n=1 Tax=Liparis tanakae TaxID=230148 RepID=A0A4Z2I9M8_9TELE|nr:hypothetical protein EYF80_015044 [Liparis tanakae]